VSVTGLNVARTLVEVFLPFLTLPLRVATSLPVPSLKTFSQPNQCAREKPPNRWKLRRAF